MKVNARTEEFQHIELFDKYALFTNARIDRSTVPKGWYCYDFRGSDDDSGELCYIEKSVTVNHAGSVLMPEKLEILKNEKYKGDAILQKSYTTASFPRKRKNNHGERNAYYMEGSHAAIISDVDFEAVQKIRAGRRRSTGITNTVLRGALYCCCESPLRMRMSGPSVYWVCIRHSHSSSACPITQIPEAQIQQAFLRLYYNLKH